MSPVESSAIPCGARNLPASRPGPFSSPSRAMRLPLASTMVRRGPRFGALRLTGMPGPRSPTMKFGCLPPQQCSAGPVQIVPLRLVSAVAVEHLHAVVLAVGDIDPAVGVSDDVMDDVELAGVGAGLAPGPDPFSIGCEFVDAGIAVTVGHIDLALRRQRRMGAAVERLAAHERRRLVRNADGQQHLAIAGAFADGVVAVVGAIEIVVGIDVRAGGAREQASPQAL